MIGARASDQTQKGTGHKPNSIKKKKKLNIMSAFNFYRDLFDESCKKYCQDSQQGFSQNLKVVLTKGVHRPKLTKSTQPSLTFKQNKATGGFEVVRQNKKRKNMEVEAPEMKPIGSLNSKFQKFEKEKSIAPQLKRNRMSVENDNKSKTTSITLSFKGGLKKSLPIVNQPPQKRPGAFSNPRGSEVRETTFKPKKSPLRQIDFEEEKTLERHMYQVDLEDVLVGPNRHKREIGLQTSEVKPSNKQSRVDGNCQTSPLREKNLTNLPVNLKMVENKNVVANKQENSQQICIENTFSKQVDNSVNNEVHDSIEINRAEQQTEVEINKVLRFDLMENLNEQKQPEATQEMPSRPEERVQAPLQVENPDIKASAKKLFSLETQKNSFTQPPIEVPTSSETKTFVPTSELGSAKKFAVAAPKPVFDFLKPYEQKQPETSMVNDNNPFLSHKPEAPVQQQEVQNAAALPDSNPFLKSENTQFGILGLIGNTSSDKIMNNFDGGLKQVSNIGLFNSTPQSLFGPAPTAPTSSGNVNNGLFSNANTIQRNPMNNNGPNNGNAPNPLFSNLNTAPQNFNNQAPPSFANQLFGNDRMDISDNSLSMQQQPNIVNGLFNSNMHSNNMNTMNTPSFLQNNNSTNNGLFSNLAPSQPPMGQNSVSNGLFSNNMMPGNNMNQSMGNSLFSNQSMNNQPQNQLFMNSSNNGMMNNQLNFNNAPSPTFLPQQQQPQMNLFNNNMSNSNAMPPAKLVFGNNNNQGPFTNNSNNNMMTNNMNNMNNCMNNDMNPFVNNNNMNMTQPFQRNNQDSNMTQGMNFMGNQRTAQDAQNFLGLGGNAGGNSNGGDSNQANPQARVYRRIMQPSNKNKERAY